MNPIQTITTRNSQTINVVIEDHLVADVPALTTKNEDGSYTIALNGKYAFEKLQREYLHELRHIEERHHDLETADLAEKKVRRLPEPKTITFIQIGIDLRILYDHYRTFMREEQKREVQAKYEVDQWIRSLESKARRAKKEHLDTDDLGEAWASEMREKYGMKRK